MPRWAPTLLLCACALSPQPATPARPLPGQGPAAQDLKGWRGFTRVNPRRFRSKGHGQVWVDIYVDAEHASAYLAHANPAPVGLRVVVAGFDDAEKPEPTGVMAMVKLPPGSAGGDWYYAVLAPDGASATTQGHLELCAGCHDHVPDGDHLFGVVEAPPEADAGVSR